MRWIRFCGVFFVMLAVACGSNVSTGVPTLTPTPGEIAPTLVPPTVVTQETGPAPTATPRTSGAQDAPNRLFVDLVNGNDAGEGKRGTPLLTLGAALNKAATLNNPDVFVSAGQINGTHNISTLVRLFGGFNPETWERDFEVETSIVAAGYALNITGDGVRVDGFTLQTTGVIGVNSVAVLVDGATDVSLTNNKIISANGVGGAAGANGTVGRPGADGQSGTAAGDCTSSLLGGAGGSGAGLGGHGGEGMPKSGLAGESGSDGGGLGGKRGNPNQDGKPGEDGENGPSSPEPGEGGDPFGVLDEFGYTPANGKDGSGDTGDGKPGGGGGGGGGGGRINSPCGGGGGGGGAGGIGATVHGTGGTGGGASIGVLVMNGDVLVTGSAITTGNGGPGGRGGDGGLGGPGGKGGNGGARSVTLGGGGSGGDGGRGGDSAPGGGGGGGPSIGVLSNFNSNVTVNSTEFNIGSGGAGGEGGAPPDADGEPGVSGAKGFESGALNAPEREEEDEES